MQFGSESTMASAEALVAIQKRVQGLRCKDAKIARHRGLHLGSHNSGSHARPHGPISCVFAAFVKPLLPSYSPQTRPRYLPQ